MKPLLCTNVDDRPDLRTWTNTRKNPVVDDEFAKGIRLIMCGTSELETSWTIYVSLLLGASAQTVSEMLGSIVNASSRFDAIQKAIDEELELDERDCATAILKYTRTVFKLRNRLAHDRVASTKTPGVYILFPPKNITKYNADIFVRERSKNKESIPKPSISYRNSFYYSTVTLTQILNQIDTTRIFVGQLINTINVPSSKQISFRALNNSPHLRPIIDNMKKTRADQKRKAISSQKKSKP